MISFEDFGPALIRTIKEIAKERPKTPPDRPISEPVQAKIAILSANPLDREETDSKLLQKLGTLGFEIDYFHLSLEQLFYPEDYDYIFVIAKVIKNRLLIEDEFFCGKRITFQDFDDALGSEVKGIFFFLDQLPEDKYLEQIQSPTLLFQTTQYKDIKKVVHQLSKGILKEGKNSTFLNQNSLDLSGMQGKNKRNSHLNLGKIALPTGIDRKSIKSFVGRKDDLAKISHQLAKLELGEGILTLKGSGGLGKTTIAKKMAVAYADRGYFEDGIHFVDCEPITNFQQFQRKVASGYNLEHADDFLHYLRSQHEGEQRLLILDNFETLLHLSEADQITELVSQVCDYAKILVTSREVIGVEWEVVHEIRQFTTDEGETLFLQDMDRKKFCSKELTLLREEIVENLLDNNPLAIKLIKKTMPKGKKFVDLKGELEKNFFGKISESDIAVFDEITDQNIERKKSLYASIFYSYQFLNDAEKQAFELLSLFPDGLNLEKFKKLTRNPQKRAEEKETIKPLVITDKIIKALEDKSMIESNDDGHIGLQSIIARFAQAQLNKRPNRTYFYQRAFNHNFSLAKALFRLSFQNRSLSSADFDVQQENFLKSLQYCHQIKLEDEVILEHLSYLNSLFTDVCSLQVLSKELVKNPFHLKKENQIFLQIIDLSSQYYDGDFENAFFKLQNLVPKQDLKKMEHFTWLQEDAVMQVAYVYEMEGDELFSIQFQMRINYLGQNYPRALFALGEYNFELAEITTDPFFSFQIQANLAALELEDIDSYLEKCMKNSIWSVCSSPMFDVS